MLPWENIYSILGPEKIDINDFVKVTTKNNCTFYGSITKLDSKINWSKFSLKTISNKNKDLSWNYVINFEKSKKLSIGDLVYVKWTSLNDNPDDIYYGYIDEIPDCNGGLVGDCVSVPPYASYCLNSPITNYSNKYFLSAEGISNIEIAPKLQINLTDNHIYKVTLNTGEEIIGKLNGKASSAFYIILIDRNNKLHEIKWSSIVDIS
ncbi:hypothetical protein [Mycoplasmoides alvi]|uniref:hypothetical protein n=1 Tax=Mycoplasmoides alvi TaxID=78580 RepID=UPI00051B0F2C|nr:hypothetical protein [Mycoplasmoides alvi]